MRLHRILFTAVEIGSNDSLPTEFRLFRAGVNESENGPVTFDAAAAELVMAHNAKWGIDLPIDLEHQSFDVPLRDDLGDARGWFNLELREGELWAVNVRWTPDGERRLRNKTQRYISPAFNVAEIEGADAYRVTAVINCALTALPATHGAMPLVAANAHTKLELRMNTMDPDMIKAAIAALKEGNGESALALLEEAIVAAAGGASEAPESDDSAEGAPAEAALASDGDPPPEEEDEPEKMSLAPEDVRALNARLAATGHKSLSAFLQDEARLRKAQEKVAEREAEIELDTRRELVGRLVKFGFETPATAWASNDDGVDPVPCARLSAEPIEELRARVELMCGSRKLTAPKAPARGTTTRERRKLSAHELKAIDAKGWTVDEYWKRVDEAAHRV